MRITSVQLQFDNTGISDAMIYFRYDAREGTNASDDFYFSGNLSVTGDVYLQNTSLDALRQLVLSRIQETATQPTGQVQSQGEQTNNLQNVEVSNRQGVNQQVTDQQRQQIQESQQQQAVQETQQTQEAEAQNRRNRE